MKWARIRLTCQPEELWSRRKTFFLVFFFFPFQIHRWAGVQCSTKWKPFQEMVLQQKRKKKKERKVVIFLSRNISHLFEASLILTNYLSNLWKALNRSLWSDKAHAWPATAISFKYWFLPPLLLTGKYSFLVTPQQIRLFFPVWLPLTPISYWCSSAFQQIYTADSWVCTADGHKKEVTLSKKGDRWSLTELLPANISRATSSSAAHCWPGDAWLHAALHPRQHPFNPPCR